MTLLLSIVFRSMVVASLLVLAEGKLVGSYPHGRMQQDQIFVEESGDCLQFEDSAVQNARFSEIELASPECDTNDCVGGCCRYHTLGLVCDKDDDFPHQPVSANIHCQEEDSPFHSLQEFVSLTSYTLFLCCDSVFAI
jgi:hypothetical protein